MPDVEAHIGLVFPRALRKGHVGVQPSLWLWGRRGSARERHRLVPGRPVARPAPGARFRAPRDPRPGPTPQRRRKRVPGQGTTARSALAIGRGTALRHLGGGLLLDLPRTRRQVQAPEGFLAPQIRISGILRACGFLETGEGCLSRRLQAGGGLRECRPPSPTPASGPRASGPST